MGGNPDPLFAEFEEQLAGHAIKANMLQINEQIAEGCVCCYSEMSFDSLFMKEHLVKCTRESIQEMAKKLMWPLKH